MGNNFILDFSEESVNSFSIIGPSGCGKSKAIEKILKQYDIPDVTACNDINDAFARISKLLEKDRFNEAVEMASIYIYAKIFGPLLAEDLCLSFGSMLEKVKKYWITRK